MDKKLKITIDSESRVWYYKSEPRKVDKEIWAQSRFDISVNRKIQKETIQKNQPERKTEKETRYHSRVTLRKEKGASPMYLEIVTERSNCFALGNIW